MNDESVRRSVPSLQVMLHRMFETQPRLPPGTALTIGIACLVAVAFPVTWSFVRYLGTMAHEGSHAVVGSLYGRKIEGIRLHLKDATGSTDAPGEGGNVPILFIGYFGPSLLGLGAAKLIAMGHSVAVLWLTLALLALLLAQMRNVIGMLLIVVAGYVIYIFARYGTVARETLAAYGIAWLLLLVGIRTVLHRWGGSGDGQGLKAWSGSSQEVFSQIWLVGALFALFLGTRMLM
ncbi:MAG TPA: M50 family metallopeptidase [Streptosporangiaceae bacterium]